MQFNYSTKYLSGTAEVTKGILVLCYIYRILGTKIHFQWGFKVHSVADFIQKSKNFQGNKNNSYIHTEDTTNFVTHLRHKLELIYFTWNGLKTY